MHYSVFPLSGVQNMLSAPIFQRDIGSREVSLFRRSAVRNFMDKILL